MRVILIRIRIEQAVGVDDEIAHAGVVDGALRGAFPSVVRRFVIRERADEIDFAQILELGAVEALEFAADDEVQQLFVVAHDASCVRESSRGSGSVTSRSSSKL